MKRKTLLRYTPVTILSYSRCDAIEEANAGRDFGDCGR